MSEPEGRGAPQEVAEEAAWAVVGVLGGTGDQGRGLASRLATAGNRVIIGSRDAGRAAAAAATCGSPPQVTGMENEEAARTADVVIAAMPWEGHADLLKQLARALEGKIVIDCVNPIAFDSHGAYPFPVPEGDDRHATDLVQALAERIPGVRGVYAGRLRNCGQVEALTCNLVSVNRRYKAHAGLRVTDI